MAIIYVSGTFDLLHSGHINLFKSASKLGRVIVSLNRDAFVERYKHVTPTMPLKERIAVIRELKCVSAVVINTGDEDSTQAILEVQPDFILHGDDWTGEALMKQMNLTAEFLEGNNIKLLYLPYTQDISSTKLRK